MFCAIIRGEKTQTSIGAFNTYTRSNRRKGELSMATSDSTTCSVYRIVCFSTGKCYVGQTIHPQTRKQEHFRKLKQDRHQNIKLQHAYNKYGVDSFYFEILESEIPEEAINEREAHWVSHFDSFANGYNMDEGGRSYPNSKTAPCEWNGVHYESTVEASRAIGVHENTLRRWLKSGLKQDSDTDEFKRAIPISWNGIDYPSLAHAARAANIDRKVIEYYVEQGWRSDADVKHRKIACIWNGIQYGSIREAARACGVTDSAMVRRIKLGYTCDQDMKKPYLMKGYNLMDDKNAV